jgi:hypothetical protein
LNGRGGGAEKAVALAEQVDALDQLTSRDSLVQALAEGGRCAPELGRCAPELESFSRKAKKQKKSKRKQKESKRKESKRTGIIVALFLGRLLELELRA